MDYFESGYKEVGKLLNYMSENPEKFNGGISHSIVSENDYDGFNENNLS